MKDSNNIIRKYAGLGSQFMIGLGLFLFCGIKLDDWLKFNTPVFVWILPLIFIIAAIIKLIIETGKNK